MKTISLHEQTNDRAVSLSIRATELTSRKLAEAMLAYLQRAKKPDYKKGYQSLRTLSNHGASLANIEISGEDIVSFRRIAKKFNVDYALQKDNSTDPPRWLVFFKAVDARALESAFEEYSKLILSPAHSIKTPLLERLEKLKELAKSVLSPVRNRDRGELEL